MERCPFSSKDAREASLLFRATVSTVNTRDCTPEQIIVSLQLREVVEQEAHDVPSHRPRELLERVKLLGWVCEGVVHHGHVAEEDSKRAEQHLARPQIKLRVHLVGRSSVLIRWGFLSDIRLDRSNVKEVVIGEFDAPKAESVDLSSLEGSTCWVILKEPVERRFLAGKVKMIRYVKVSPDNAASFKRALREPIDGRLAD